MLPWSQSTARPPVGGVVSVDDPAIWPFPLIASAIPAVPPSVGSAVKDAVLPDERAIACVPDNLAGFIDVIGVCTLDRWIEDSEIGDGIRARVVWRPEVHA